MSFPADRFFTVLPSTSPAREIYHWWREHFPDRAGDQYGSYPPSLREWLHMLLAIARLYRLPDADTEDEKGMVSPDFAGDKGA